MCTKDELLQFLTEFPDDAQVAIEEGGLALEVYDSEGTTFLGYFEVGGDPNADPDPEPEETTEAAPRALPVVEFAGKRWYQDDRLEEYRAVDNPHERLTFAEVGPVVDGTCDECGERHTPDTDCGAI